MTILIVDMNYKKDSLSYFEFVKPILSVLEPIEPCKVKQYLELKPSRTPKIQPYNPLRNHAQRLRIPQPPRKVQLATNLYKTGSGDLCGNANHP